MRVQIIVDIDESVKNDVLYQIQMAADVDNLSKIESITIIEEKEEK